MSCCCSMAGTSACNNCNTNITHNTINWLNLKTIFNAPEKKRAKPVIKYWCGDCSTEIDKYSMFCPNCGVNIDWDFDKITLDN